MRRRNESEMLRKVSKERYLSLEEYCYLRKKFENSRINNLSLSTRKKLHPLLLLLIKLRNRLCGYHLKVIGNDRERTERSIIYAVTHIGKADIELVSEAIKAHYFLLCGDFENLHGTIDGFFLGLNGVLYFDEKNKEERRDVKERMKRVLRDGGNVLYFPEGTWNLTANLPLNKCYYGIIEVAKEADAIIIPIGIEQYGKEFIAKVGRNFDVRRYTFDKYDKREIQKIIIRDLRDELATLKWEIWESVPPLVRGEIEDGYYQKFVQDKIGEWNLEFEAFTNAIYKDKDIVDAEEVFAPIKKLSI